MTTPSRHPAARGDLWRRLWRALESLDDAAVDDPAQRLRLKLARLECRVQALEQGEDAPRPRA